MSNIAKMQAAQIAHSEASRKHQLLVFQMNNLQQQIPEAEKKVFEAIEAIQDLEQAQESKP